MFVPRQIRTDGFSFRQLAQGWRNLVHCGEHRQAADEMKEVEPKAILLRIAADYEKLAEWAEENSVPWWDKKRVVSK
jgi:hypothetical protein